MSISIKLLESNREIQKKIFDTIFEEIDRKLRKNKAKAEAKIKLMIPGWIAEQPEVDSILAEGMLGSLNAQLGFGAGTSIRHIEAIKNGIVNSIYAEIDFKKNLTGGITFYIQPIDFSNLLGSPWAFIATESAPLSWLNWLLIQGSRTIIVDYEYKPDFAGRSGGGIMIGGSVWRIPPQFAGTVDNNFITRALQNRDKELQSVMEEALYA